MDDLDRRRLVQLRAEISYQANWGDKEAPNVFLLRLLDAALVARKTPQPYKCGACMKWITEANDLNGV